MLLSFVNYFSTRPTMMLTTWMPQRPSAVSTFHGMISSWALPHSVHIVPRIQETQRVLASWTRTTVSLALGTMDFLAIAVMICFRGWVMMMTMTMIQKSIYIHLDRMNVMQRWMLFSTSVVQMLQERVCTWSNIHVSYSMTMMHLSYHAAPAVYSLIHSHCTCTHLLLGGLLN